MADVIKYRFRVRRRTAAEWTSINEILLDSEIGLESDTGLGKIGDGVTAWNSLLYTIVGKVDLTGLADNKVLKWDATNSKWIVADASATPLTTKGDIYTRSATADARLPIASNGKVLVADSAQPLGLKWDYAPALALKGRVATYAALPSSGLTAGDAYLVDGPPQQIYVWNGTAWPAEGQGLPIGGGMSAPNYSDLVLADGPIAFWKLDETSGTTAADSSGNARDGTYTGGFDLGVAPTINLPGAALFDGSSGHVNIPYGAWMNVSNVTLECWAYVLANPTARVGYITRKFASAGNIPYALETAADSGTTPQMAQYNGSAWASVKSVPSMPTFGWVHLVGTKDSTGKSNIYMNGIKANVPNTITPVTTSTEGIFLGRQHNYVSSSLYIAGALSCCAIYDKVLTPEQVAEHYNAGSIPKWLTS